MTKVILAAVPFQGHVAPVLTVAADLVGRGHEVVVYTGSQFEQRALATGARFHAIPAEADFDDRNLDAHFPARAALPAGPAQIAFDLKEIFLGRVPAQLRGLRALLAEFPADVVIGEVSFQSTQVLHLATPPGQRPALVTLGIVAPTFQSDDAPPFGPGVLPLAGDEGRARHRAMNAEFRQMFGEVQEHAEKVFESVDVRLPHFLLDSWVHRTDHYLQLTVPGFEYPRTDAPAHFQFVGALPPDPGAGYVEPQWWSELSDARPVVVVTQGTLANGSLGDLVVPTLRALADLDVLVVAATVREEGPDQVRAAMGEVPANVRLATFVPFARLLPYADVFVTNGGYGGVQTALRHGVPMVVAGASEDKPEVAARVQWSGTGINLRTATPDVAAIRQAVEDVLDNPNYRYQAQAISKEYDQYQPFDAIARIVERA